MCSRFQNKMPASAWAERIDGITVLQSAATWSPHEDERPSHEVLVIYNRVEDGPVLSTAFWGFPRQKPGGGKPELTINTRIESLGIDFWQDTRRCWMPVTSWIEWIDEGRKKVLQRLTLRSGEPFLLAGVYGMRNGVPRVSMMMQPAPAALAYIHHRAPLAYGLDAVHARDPH